MSEEIISLLSNKDTISLSIDDISKRLNIKNKEELKKELNKMVSAGILDYSSRKNKYLLFENSHLHKGRLLLDKFGNGIVKLDGEKILIPKKSLKGASYNDLISFDYDERDNQGVVTRIIERDNSNYVCTIKSIDDKLYIDDSRLGKFIVEDKDIVEGNVVLINHKKGINKIVSILGHKDDPDIDIKSILYTYGFENEFNEKIMRELEDIPTTLSNEEIEKELNNGRVDYRDRKVFTIDGNDTKDIDDALSIRKLDNGNIELIVFIADVAHFINEKSALYEEAIRRGTSVYPPNSVIPMFPHKISNGICSLKPNSDRFVMAYTNIIDKKGNVIDSKVEEAIIRSSKQMTYEEVNQVLNNNIIDGYQDYLKELLLLYKLTLLIDSNLEKNGRLDFSMDESKVILDEEYKPIEIVKRKLGPAEKIIENAMVITNTELSKYAYYLNLPWIYRNHGLPNQEKLSNVVTALKLNGYISNDYSSKNINAKEIQNIIKDLKDNYTTQVFYRLLIKAQDEANYGEINIGHYALGLDFYSHNTSPIRRAADLRNQVILKNFLHNGIEDTYEKYTDTHEDALNFSRKQRRAKQCERDIVDKKKAEYMGNYIGRELTGIISYVTDYGFYVLLDNTVEGFVRISDLPQGKYVFNEERLSLSSKKHDYVIGDYIDIKVKNADKELSLIEFTTKDYIEDKNKNGNYIKKKMKK